MYCNEEMRRFFSSMGYRLSFSADGERCDFFRNGRYVGSAKGKWGLYRIVYTAKYQKGK